MSKITIIDNDFVYLNGSKVHTKEIGGIRYLCLRDILRVIDKDNLFCFDFYISPNQKISMEGINVLGKKQEMNFVSEKGFKRLVNLYMGNHKNKGLKELQDKYQIKILPLKIED